MKWWDLLSRLVQAAIGQWAQSLLRDLAHWRWQLFQCLLLAMLASVCGLIVLVLVALLVALAFWDTHRLEALGALVLVYALLTAGTIRRAARLMAPAADSFSSGRSHCPACRGCPSRPGGACCGN